MTRFHSVDPIPDTHVSKVETQPHKPVRRLKPEVAAKFASFQRDEKIKQLYTRPVDELSPEELAKMRAAFFRS